MTTAVMNAMHATRGLFSRRRRGLVDTATATTGISPSSLSSLMLDDAALETLKVLSWVSSALLQSFIVGMENRPRRNAPSKTRSVLPYSPRNQLQYAATPLPYNSDGTLERSPESHWSDPFDLLQEHCTNLGTRGRTWHT